MRTEVPDSPSVLSLRAPTLRLATDEALLLAVRGVEGIPSSLHHRLVRNPEVIVWVSQALVLLLWVDWGLLTAVESTSFLPRANLLPHTLPYVEVVVCWLQHYTAGLILLDVELGVFGLASAARGRMVEVVLRQCKPCYIFICQIRCVLHVDTRLVGCLIHAAELGATAGFGGSGGRHHAR